MVILIKVKRSELCELRGSESSTKSTSVLFYRNTMNNDTYKNESASDYSAHLKIFVIINCGLNAPLMLFSIIGNSLVLAAILRTPSLRSPFMILLCSLALSDLLVGLVTQPLYITQELKEDELLLSVISGVTTFSCCGVSLCTMTAISLDRFAALHYHMRYVTMVTTTRLVYHFSCKLNFLLEFTSIFYHCIYFYFYLSVFQIVKRHQMQIQAQQQSVQSLEASNNFNITRLKKSSMNTFVFYIFLILCYFPTFILMMLSGIFRMEWTKTWSFSATVVFMNSSINPILYCWRLSELRSAVLKTARKMLCTQAVQE